MLKKCDHRIIVTNNATKKSNWDTFSARKVSTHLLTEMKRVQNFSV